MCSNKASFLSGGKIMLKKGNRIDYLYPKNTSERYKKWIENARIPLIGTIKDCEIISLTFEDYLQLIGVSYTEKTPEEMEDFYKYDYKPWKCGKSNLRLLNFNSGNIINIHQKVIH